MKNFKTLDWIALILLLIGGLNWGLVGLFNFSLVHAIFGNLLARLIYIVVGVAAGFKIYLLYLDYSKPTKAEAKTEEPVVAAPKAEPPKAEPPKAEPPKEEPPKE